MTCNLACEDRKGTKGFTNWLSKWGTAITSKQTLQEQSGTFFPCWLEGQMSLSYVPMQLSLVGSSKLCKRQHGLPVVFGGGARKILHLAHVLWCRTSRHTNPFCKPLIACIGELERIQPIQQSCESLSLCSGQTWSAVLGVISTSLYISLYIVDTYVCIYLQEIL